jgi:hypothetical protein
MNRKKQGTLPFSPSLQGSIPFGPVPRRQLTPAVTFAAPPASTVDRGSLSWQARIRWGQLGQLGSSSDNNDRVPRSAIGVGSFSLGLGKPHSFHSALAVC